MNADTSSIKSPKECSKKFVATLVRKLVARGNALRIFFLFLEDLGAPLQKRLSPFKSFRIFHVGINFQLQIQSRAATRINLHYTVGISAESLSVQIQILS